ncbi:hypothetical protein BUALT_Bualt07G0090300 [Buddleja alternifolia]|uniref:RecQ-mediated genome instability protein 1 n=1 Tax=Buddleja alternifolia TaxID=168488 RepID=A0AAV6XK77_9LAMI|nr:hypothetical protein BUALT_Bualt07G0090300 [Buddleja alternifolia]
MSRRRLRVVCSSDEEDEPPPLPPQNHQLEQQQQEEDIDDVVIDDIETDFQTVNINSSNPTPNTDNSTTANLNRNGSRPSEPIPLDLSDGDEENVINNGTANHSSYGSRNDNQSYFGVLSDSPVNGVLEILGVRLKSEWLDSCLHGLQASVHGFNGLDDSAKSKLCFEQFLHSDMNYCGAGVLPPNVHALHLVDLKGPFVLQVDEIVNISCPLRGRYQSATPGVKRCLKLSMTDGVQRVFGMEYRPIKDLEVMALAGLKVAIYNVNVRHGLLMLVPEVLEVLGGSVEELEAARQRLVNEINKPPRGKRNRIGEIPPLGTRATLAAWPPQNDAVPGHADRTTRVDTTTPQASGQGNAVGIPANYRHRQAVAVPVSRNGAEHSTTAAAQPQEYNEVPRGTAGQGSPFFIPANDRPRQDFEVLVSRSNAVPSTMSTVRPPARVIAPQHIEDPPTEVTPPARETGQLATPIIPFSRDNDAANTSSAVDMDVEEIRLVDELEHPFILSRDKESPFTYLASLSAKLAAIQNEAYSVRGKIKCFLTGVKGFQYKQRASYELRVYVDDGSLISEILIDHNVVQNGIGYSPQEVTSALASSDTKRVSEMKETLKLFQIFLVNFEGTMVVEMNKASTVPIAVEMEQGCPPSDAWLLLKRLKSFTSAPPQQNQSNLNPIYLSP